MAKEKAFEYKKIKSNGAIHHLIKYKDEKNWKLHSWDGPAIQPISEDCPLKPSYYLNGFEYSKEEYENRLSEREGLPFYKQPGFDDARL